MNNSGTSLSKILNGINSTLNIALEDYTLKLKFDKSILNIDIFYDLLKYIVPAGIIIQFENEENKLLQSDVALSMTSNVKITDIYKNNEVGSDTDIFNSKDNTFSPVVGLAEVDNTVGNSGGKQ